MFQYSGQSKGSVHWLRLFLKSGNVAPVIIATLIAISGLLIAYKYGIVHAMSEDWTQANFTKIATGESSACGISNGAAYCWGSNASGQLGDNSTNQSQSPVAVDTTGVLAGKTVTDISVGNTFACAVAGGAAYCWGTNTVNGQLGNNSTAQSLVPVAVDASTALSGKTVTAIASGYGYSCVIANSAAYCWGYNSSGQLGNNSTTISLVPVAVDVSGVLASKTITDISTGNGHSCAVGSGLAYCWGSGANGRLGRGSTTQSLVPVAVTAAAGVLAGKTVTDISAGNGHSCAVASGAAYCWGFGSSGQLGNNLTTQQNSPVVVTATGVLSGVTVTSISAGANHTCAVGGGAAYCWGVNTINGALGNNSTAQFNVPVAVNTAGVLSGKAVTSIAVGFGLTTAPYSCAVADTTGYCWGFNGSGQLGDNSIAIRFLVPVAVKKTTYATTSSHRFFANANSSSPGASMAATDQAVTLPATGSAFRVRAGVTATIPFSTTTNISIGSTHSCAVANSLAYCWGEEVNGRIGSNATGATTPYPVDVTGALSGKTVSSISTTTTHSCAVASGAAYCWGLNTNGQLGNNSTTQSLVPVAVDVSGVLAGKTVTAVSAGDTFSCVVASGAPYCWGINTNGQLGNNSTTQSLVPVAVDVSGVLAGKTVTSITAGATHTCSIANSAAYCWGANTANGQLGNNSTTQSLVPVAVDVSGVLAGKTVTSIDNGLGYTCVVASGAPYCWGSNASSQFGNNSSGFSLVPVATYMGGALSGKTVTSISAGYSHTCAIANGAAYCWGNNSNGQLGNNSTSNAIAAVAVDITGVLASKTVTSIATSHNASFNYTCAVADGAAYCWGYNNVGQLGNSSTVQSIVPAATPAVSRNIAPQMTTLKLQYALKTASTCSTQNTGFADVTTSSAIAWHTNAGVADGAAISSDANDPTPSVDTAYQTYESSGSTFTNTSMIPAGKHGLWDFSLEDNSGLGDTSYCIKIVYATGSTPLDLNTTYPEVRTAMSGLTIGFVTSGGVPVATPSFAMQTMNLLSACQTTTATLGSIGGDRLRITQIGGAGNGWNASIAPANGRSGSWARNDAGSYYDFNDPSGSPAGCNSGSDGDGIAGQLTLGLSGTTLSPQGGCSTTGLSTGSGNTAFSDSVVDAITITSASSAAQANCYWDVYGTGLSQTIPANQAAGSYDMTLTVTIVAQ